jgi:hypothetical protein
MTGPRIRPLNRAFANRAAGSISWPKELGHPDSISFADGFTVTHRVWDLEGVAGGGGHRVTPYPVEPRLPPMLLRHTEDDTRYHVGFLCFLKIATDNEISVTLSDVRWLDAAEPPFAQRRHVYPNFWPFRLLAFSPQTPPPDMRAEVVWRRIF